MSQKRMKRWWRESLKEGGMILKSSLGMPSGPILLLLGRVDKREEKVVGHVMRESMEVGIVGEEEWEERSVNVK